jgi:translation initiation factor IF-1
LTKGDLIAYNVNRKLCRYREGSTLSRDDLIQLEGVVTKILGYGTMEIECEDNIIVRGVLCGRMKKRRIKVMKGDRVQVRVSPYDTSHGLITWRFR